MASSRRWASGAAGVCRLLLEQPAGSAAAAGARTWLVELRSAAAVAAGSSSSTSVTAVGLAPGAARQLHSQAGGTLRLWLPAAAAEAAEPAALRHALQRRGPRLRLRQHQHQQLSAQLAWQQQWQQMAWLHVATPHLFSIHHDSVKSHLTNPPPMAGVSGWEAHLPHQHLPPHQHPRPASGGTAYEAADAGEGGLAG